MKPSTSIVAVAAIQLFVSFVVWAPSELLLYDEAQLYRRYSAAAFAPNAAIRLRHEWPAYDAVLVGVPLFISGLGISSSVGLLRLRNWARTMMLWFASVPVSICALIAMLDRLRGPSAGLDISPFIVRLLLVLLAAVSIWWFDLLTRTDVKAQFCSGGASGSTNMYSQLVRNPIELIDRCCDPRHIGPGRSQIACQPR